MLKRTVGLAAAVLVLTSGLAACGDDDSSEGTDASSSETTTTEPTSDPTTGTTPEATETATSEPVEPETSAAPGADEVSCTYAPSAVPGTATPPPATAVASGTRDIKLDTTIGELDLTLDAAAAPCTVNSFVSLTEQGYFDGTTCHRLTTAGIFVLQCGDPGNGPGGPGTGGPGYGIVDEFPDVAAYGPGTLAMAKTPAPDSGGSQFFIVYDGPETQLPPEYTIFGSVTAGLDKLQAAAAEGTVDGGPDGTPKVTVTIDTATAE